MCVCVYGGWERRERGIGVEGDALRSRDAVPLNHTPSTNSPRSAIEDDDEKVNKHMPLGGTTALRERVKWRGWEGKTRTPAEGKQARDLPHLP